MINITKIKYKDFNTLLEEIVQNISHNSLEIKENLDCVEKKGYAH